MHHIDISCVIVGFFFEITAFPNKVSLVTNENNDLVPTRVIVGYGMCVDFRKLNKWTTKDHYLMSFINEMLERLANNSYFCYLDGYSGFSQIPIRPEYQEKTTFTCPYDTYTYCRMPFGLCNRPPPFQKCISRIFSDFVEKIVEVFMDNFLSKVPPLIIVSIIL